MTIVTSGVLVLMIGGGVIRYRWLTRRLTRHLSDLPLPSDAATATFVGGLRWPPGMDTPGGHVSPPFVQLRLDAEGIHLSPNGTLAGLLSRLFPLPSYHLTWTQLERAERLRNGVRFISPSLVAPLIFLTAEPGPVLAAVAAHGVAVEQAVQSTYSALPRLRIGPLTRSKLVVIGSSIFTLVFANLLWSVTGLPATDTSALRVLLLIVVVVAIVATVVIPDEYWTRGR